MSKQKTLLDVYQNMDDEGKTVVEYLVGRLYQATGDSVDLEQSGIGSYEDFLAAQGVTAPVEEANTKT